MKKRIGKRPAIVMILTLAILITMVTGCTTAPPAQDQPQPRDVEQAQPVDAGQPDALSEAIVGTAADIGPDVTFKTIEAFANGIMATGEVVQPGQEGDVMPLDITDPSLVTIKVTLIGDAEEAGTNKISLTSEELGDGVIYPAYTPVEVTQGEALGKNGAATEYFFTFAAALGPVDDLVVVNEFISSGLIDPMEPPPAGFSTSIVIPLVNGNAPAPAVTNPVKATEGYTVKLPAVTANAGFVFSTWQVKSGGVTIINPTSANNASFVMGTSNVELSAVFVPANLTFTNLTLPNGTVGLPYSANVNMPTGGSGLFTYAAAVPAGLTMSAAGAITGTPNAAVTSQTFNVTAIDTRSGASATATYTITINRAEQILKATPINSVVENSPIDLAGHVISTAGNDSGAITYSVTNAGQTGAVINGTKLSFTGIGSAIIRAEAAGSANVNLAMVEFTLTVDTTASASISPNHAVFDLNPAGPAYGDITITLSPAGHELTAIVLGDTELATPRDYSVNGNVYTIHKEFLGALPEGDYTIIFMMNGGQNPELMLTVMLTVDSEPIATPEPAPAGGPPIWLIVLPIAAAAAVVTILLVRRNKKASKNK